ncbi:MAG: hypothetical protein KIH89_004850 [Candidatus Shapirobacteria bacterium]|nr:hypothetical protein [Candidatus Shapirobacteria bacterium]
MSEKIEGIRINPINRIEPVKNHLKRPLPENGQKEIKTETKRPEDTNQKRHFGMIDIKI